jgi:hypothetical protein
MVLENTRRIINNEQMIDELRKRETEEDQKRRERDEFWESVNRDHARARQEHDRDMRELRQMFKESREEFDKSKVEFDRRMAESQEKFDKQMAETNAQIRRISVEFLGINGHLVEGLASSATDKIFKDAGLDLLHYGKNIKPKHAEDNKQMEIDVLLGNDRFTVPVEVKANCTKKKIRRFLHQMEMFRKLFPEYADKEIIAAVAAINYEDGADQLAHNEGLLVIRVNSDDIFSLDPFDMEELKRF